MLSLAIVASLTLTTPVMAATNTSIAKLQEEQKAHNQKIADDNKAAVEAANLAKVAAQKAAVEATKAAAEAAKAKNAAIAAANKAAVEAAIAEKVAKQIAAMKK